MTLKHPQEVSAITATFFGLRPHFFHKPSKDFSSSTPIVIDAIAQHYQSTSTPLTITRLAQSTTLTTAAISQILNPLEQRCLIRRTKSPTDRRETHITLTRKGKHLLRHFSDRSHHAAFLDDLLEYLGPEDSDHLIHLCARIKDFISTQKSTQKPNEATAQ